MWRATSADATVTLTVAADSDTVSVFGTNAGSIIVTVKDITETTTLWGPYTYDLRGVDTLYKFMTDTAESFTSIWAEYTYQSVEHKIILEFDASAGIVVEAGIIRAGSGSEYLNPLYGLNNSYKDYSVVKELNNGATWIDSKIIVRTFSGSFHILRNGEFPTFMTQFQEVTGVQPLAWLVTDLLNQVYSIFARCQTLPSASHNYVDYSTVSFELIEMV